MDQETRDYHVRRARAERAAAEKAADDYTRDCHEKLAALHEAKAAKAVAAGGQGERIS